MNTATFVGAPQQFKPRYGCFAARIGALFAHRLEKALRLNSGHILNVGETIHITVVDESRHPEADGHKKWRCSHPSCNGKRWDSKKALVAQHAPNRELEKLEEAHCFWAVAQLDGVEGKDAKVDKQGNVIEVAVPARPPTVLLLSDEE